MTTLTPSETTQDEALRIYNETYGGAYALHLAREYDRQWRREEIWRWRERAGAGELLGSILPPCAVITAIYSPTGLAFTLIFIVVGACAIGVFAWERHAKHRLRDLGEQ